MKKLSLVLIATAAAVVPLSLSSAQLGPVWHGPKKPVAWNGLLSLSASSGVAAVAPALPQAVVDTTPRWVGYVKRGQEWYFRFQLSSQKIEVLRRGATTSDGWALINFAMQGYRPDTVTLSKDGVEKTLQFTPLQ